MRRLGAALTALLLAAGCKDEEKPASRPASPPPPGDAAAAEPAGDRAKPDAPNQADRKDAEALLTAWLAAQTSGDFAGYQKLYGEAFTGVRRSGSKVRRFDRAGWMADRGRMFQKPMAVTADAVHVIARGAQTHLFFTQTFEQGTYRDTGRKWIALERGAGGMRIAREEMLDSTLVARQEKDLAAARAGPEAKALAAGAAELGWAGKRDKLYLAPLDASGRLVIGRASGSIGSGPVTVADHTMDAAAGTLAGVSASRAVDQSKLPAPLAARLGKTVQLLDADLAPLCHARISGYALDVADWAPEKGADSPEQAAAALLDETPVVVAELQLSGCPKGAAWGRDVDLPPLPEVGTLDTADEMGIFKLLARRAEEGLPEIPIVPVAGEASRAVAAVTGHTEDSCETQEEYRIELFLLTRKGKTWQAEPLAAYSYEDAPALAVDADGDGTIDVFTNRGSHRGKESDFWRHDIRVFWPAGLGCDGCEGPDCGD